jgi:PilZ domain
LQEPPSPGPREPAQMSQGSLLIRRAPAPPARSGSDRRRHKRFALTLLGRFMRADKQEYACKLTEISVGGAHVEAPVGVDLEERIIAYFDQIGGIEGHVVRVFDGGFALRIVATRHKREKLAAQITWLVNRHELTTESERRHSRTELTNKPSTLKLAEGIVIQTKLLDISVSGASIGTEARPPIGAEVLLGKLRARVMRHHEKGIGVQFLDIQDPEALRRYFS